MKIIKRNGSEVAFDITKIIVAITKANEDVDEADRMTPVQIRRIAESVELQCQKMNRAATVEEIQDMVEHHIMAHGAFFLAKACIPPMLEAGQGAMVLFSSRAAKTGFAALGSNGAKTKAHYCASKAGVISLVKSLAMELAPYGIRVNGVAPGPVQGTMIPKESWPVIAEKVPLNRLGTPEEMAEGAWFLCSPQAAFITGHILDINGGTLMD